MARVLPWRRKLVTAWHVTSSVSRESILEHGLDWQRMGAAPGIAGSVRPEQEGCFLAFDMFMVDWFLDFDATTPPLDVWEVANVKMASTVESPEGYQYLPGVIEPTRLRLFEPTSGRTGLHEVDWPQPELHEGTVVSLAVGSAGSVPAGAWRRWRQALRPSRRWRRCRSQAMSPSSRPAAGRPRGAHHPTARSQQPSDS